MQLCIDLEEWVLFLSILNVTEVMQSRVIVPRTETQVRIDFMYKKFLDTTYRFSEGI